MAEAAAALASLGVAANIFQFIDLAGRVAARGWKIYRDPDRQIEDVFDVNTLTNLTSELRDSLNVLGSNTPDCETGMVRVAEDCTKVADKLLERLSRLDELLRSGKKRDALKAAVVSVWKQDEMKALEQRLEQFKSQLSLQLLVSVRSFISKAHTQEQKEEALRAQESRGSMKEEREMLQALRETISKPWVTTPGPLILRHVCSKVRPSEFDKALNGLRPYVFEAIAASDEDIRSVYRLNESSQSGSSGRRTQSVQCKLQDRALKALDSNAMDDRQIQVSAAHSKTFRWIFEPSSVDGGPWFNFPKWLQDVHDPLYWVTGKPGSGKSTLMKFIQTYEGDTKSPFDTPVMRDLHDPILRWIRGRPGSGKPTFMNLIRTHESERDIEPHHGTQVENMLPRQDGELPWTIVNYYAWNAGQELQKSIGGLCRSLTYQLAKRHPSTLPILFPSCWEALWLLDDLGPQQVAMLEGLRGDERKTLLYMVREVTKSNRVFFLIDGLDEIEDETEEAAELVLHLATFPNVKVCASSRPWPVFEDAFGRKPHLTIHDLTKNDIITFARDKLSRGDGFSRLQNRDPVYASRLIDQIAEKSAGVFLWVDIVVKSLHRGLREDDRIIDLERRIDELPNDLDKLFTRILGNLDTFHLNHVKQYFDLLALHRHMFPNNHLKALTLSFADEQNPSFATNMPIKPLSDDEIDERVTTMVRRVESVSKGLLEVVRDPHSKHARVDYLHRTIVEYLRSKTAYEVLATAREPHRDVSLNIQMASAYLCHLKSLQTEPGSLQHNLDYEFRFHVDSVLKFIKYADEGLPEDNAAAFMKQILEMLDQVDLVGKRLAKFAAEIPPPMYMKPAAYESVQRILESGHWALSDNVLSIKSILDLDSVGNLTGGRTFLSILVQFGICNYIRERGSRRCLVQRLNVDSSKHIERAKHTIWPLLADALDANFVESRMIRQLLELGADPDFLFYHPVTTEETTPMRMAIARALKHQGGRPSFHSYEEMQDILVKMASISQRKNLPKEAEAQLNDILKSFDAGSSTCLRPQRRVS